MDFPDLIQKETFPFTFTVKRPIEIHSQSSSLFTVATHVQTYQCLHDYIKQNTLVLVFTRNRLNKHDTFFLFQNLTFSNNFAHQSIFQTCRYLVSLSHQLIVRFEYFHVPVIRNQKRLLCSINVRIELAIDSLPDVWFWEWMDLKLKLGYVNFFWGFGRLFLDCDKVSEAVKWGRGKAAHEFTLWLIEQCVDYVLLYNFIRCH